MEADLTARVITARVRERLFGGTSEIVRIGRFAVQRRLRAGAMGAVFSARDDTLERTLAIKVVHAHRVATPRARARMLREARAMARVSHANVVAIYEAGEHDGQVFIAMELVGGTTLTRWCAVPRRWSEILAMFVSVGQGLAAAHAAGVVHRDFKPDNVLVTAAGVPKVADFGLAQLLSAADEDPELCEETTASVATIGTPRYRSPEQHEGRRLDAQSDQFSFCVALFEALYGAHPFAGDTAAQLRAAVVAGRVAALPPGDVPARVRDAVLRGLATDPAARHPSMVALVDALDGDAPARRHWLALTAGALVLCAGTGTAVALGARAPAPCDHAEEAMGASWDEERRALVVERIGSVQVGYASDTAARVGRTLDGYRSEWIAAYREACEATRVHGHQSEALLDRRVACLDGRRRALDAAVDALAGMEARELSRALAVVQELPEIRRCAEAEEQGRAAPLPDDPELRRRLAQLEQLNAGAAATLLVGGHAEAERMAAQAIEQAEGLALERPELAVHDRAALTDALYTRGRARLEVSDTAAALAWLRRAYHTADEIGDDARRTRAAIAIVFAAVHSEPPSDDPERWIEHAWSALRRAGSDPQLEGALRGTIGSWHVRQGRFAQGIDELTLALELVVVKGGAYRPLNVAAIHTERGYAFVQLERLDEALADHRRALTVLGEAMGPAHPRTGLARDNLGNVLRAMGLPAQAEAEHAAAVVILEEAFGPEHPTPAKARGNLGSALQDLGRFDEALALHRRTAAELQQAYGPDHPDVTTARADVADDLAALARRGGEAR